MKSSVYILRSLKSNFYYIGSSIDVFARLGQHNSGQVKATIHRRPWVLVFHQSFDSPAAAQKIERKLKSWKRRDFIEKIIHDGSIRI